MKSKNIFNNLKDYNNELEKVLEGKSFSQEVKNLLLSMLYKVEISYADYKKTKVNVPKKEEFLNDIIQNINLNCNKIEIIKNNEMQINKKEKTIKIKQNEKVCLRAIYEISQKEVKINNQYNFAQKPLEEFFYQSSIMNKMEVIRDFDGWTWYRYLNEIENIEYFFLYQCLNLILENKVIEKIESDDKNDKIQILYNFLKKSYGENIAVNLLNSCITIISNIYYRDKIEEKKEIKKQCSNLETMQNESIGKKEFLENLSEEKKENFKRLDTIEKILKDRKLLEKEFIKRNNKGETYFSINTLINVLEREKEKILIRNEEIDDLRNPKKYAEKIIETERNIKFLKEIQNNNIDENYIDFINLIIKCFEINLNRIENKKEIIKLIYITRYFNLLEYNKEYKIYEKVETKESINAYISKLIVKAIELKALNSICDDIKESIPIYKRILRLKTIDLENIEYVINKNLNNYKLQVFDEESLEYESDIELLSTIGVKIDKKIKLFN